MSYLLDIFHSGSTVVVIVLSADANERKSCDKSLNISLITS